MLFCKGSLPPSPPPPPPARMEAPVADSVFDGPELREACLTDAALIEARRERELERVTLIGMPPAPVQREILPERGSELLPMDLPTALEWCAQHGLSE